MESKFYELTPEQLEKASVMLKSIAHPVRIAIVGLLDDEAGMSVSDIHEKIGIEQSTASHHLGILKDKGVLESKREGKNIYYSLKYSDISNIVQCISNCACKD